MNTTSRGLRHAATWLAWAAALLVGPAAALSQVNITLRPSATIVAATEGTGGARAITLGEVADFDPATAPEAVSLSGLAVSAGLADVSKITIADVRAALDGAKVNWGRLSLRGSACRVFTSAAPASASPSRSAPAAPPSPTGLSQATPQPVDLATTAETMRGAIAARLVDLYNVDAPDLRLAFDPADEPFLNESIGGRRVDVQPASNGASARTPMNVFVYDGDRVAESRVVSAQALINREVLTARQPIVRGQLITGDVVEAAHQWVAPNTKQPITQQAAIGQVAARPINAGATLVAPDVTSPVVCKRGDIVVVHVLSGLVTVRAKCRAQGQARDGELVQLKMDGSDQVFTARMSGPGRAVMLADSAEDSSQQALASADTLSPAPPLPSPAARRARPTRKSQ